MSFSTSLSSFSFQARVLRLLEKHGLSHVDADEALTQDSPVPAACYEGAVTQRVGLGPMRGRPVIKLGVPGSAG